MVKKVNQAINKVYANDSVSIRFEASEWSIAYRLALYIEEGFKGWNVDCEYNRVGTGNLTKRNSQREYRRPDIIVHHRGMVEIDHNLLIIELKTTDREEDYDEDCEKLKDFTG